MQDHYSRDVGNNISYEIYMDIYNIHNVMGSNWPEIMEATIRHRVFWDIFVVQLLQRDFKTEQRNWSFHKILKRSIIGACIRMINNLPTFSEFLKLALKKLQFVAILNIKSSTKITWTQLKECYAHLKSR